MRTGRKIVLGLNFGPDRSACLLVDGVVRAAITEERLSRTRNELPLNADRERFNAAPARAIDYCLATAEVTPREVDLVVASTSYVLKVWTGRRRKLTPDDVYRQCPALDGTPVRVVGHHFAHAASAVAAVGDAEATVLVVDGGGGIVRLDEAGEPAEFERTTIYSWRDGTLRMLARATGGPPAYGNSIDDMYQLCTEFLGFKRGEEGKTMALAAYDRRQPGWQPLPRFRTAITVGGDGLHRVEPEFQYTVDENFHPALVDWYGLPRKATDGPSATGRAVAASAQWALEKALVELATVAYGLGGGRQKLCLAGDVALNCVANSRILRDSPFAELVVQPAANDGGTALGNALVGWWALGGKAGDHPVDPAYLGRTYTAPEVAAALAEHPDAVIVDDDPADLVATLVADLLAGRVVALFLGRGEFGPGGLGHRAILCDPRHAEMIDRVNRDVKHRETFRPFASMVTEEAAREHFDLRAASPYQLLTADVRRPDQLPAITHVDGSARVQTVSAATEPFLHQVLTAFAAASGFPVLLNTSFNDRDPIVETPADAVRCFVGTGIDVLFIEGRRVTKNPSWNAVVPSGDGCVTGQGKRAGNARVRRRNDYQQVHTVTRRK
jgi:carbamoyltransferase